VAKTFVSLEERLRGRVAPTAAHDEEQHEAPKPFVAHPALAECALFRSRLRAAFDRARALLVEDLATDVLARELQLAPAAIDAIAVALFDRYAEELPVLLRVSADDRARVALDLPIEIDPSLRTGDAVLVVRDGQLESTLGTRLDAVVRAATRT
jgi:hypothetical protein